MDEIKIKPIGIIKNKIDKPKFGGWLELISEIILNEEYEKALDGIEEFSHITVIYWMSEVKTCTIKHKPQGKQEVPIVGILACRCPTRPNPIAITTVKLLEKDKNVLKVKGLDAINNTPVIDIKPYTPQYDKVENVKIPDWINKLDY